MKQCGEDESSQEEIRKDTGKPLQQSEALGEGRLGVHMGLRRKGP